MDILAEPHSVPVDPMLRIQAAILLSSVSRETFCRNIHRLILACADNDQVLCQVLVEADLLLETTGLTAAEADSVANLIEGLIRLEEELSQGSGVWPSADASPMEEIRSLVALGQRRQIIAADNTQSAWEQLRNYRRSIIEHTYDAAMWRIQLRLKNLARGSTPREPSAVAADWDTCRDFLCIDVLPNLRQLKPVLLARPVTRRLRSDDLVTWTRVINGEGPAMVDDISVRLGSAFMSMGSMDFDNVDLAKLQEDLDWWDRHFLAASIPENGDVRSAVLSEVVQQCPTGLFEVIEEVFSGGAARRDVVNLTDDYALRVFCSKQLLRDVVSHIRINAEERHRLDGVDQEFGTSVEGRGQAITVKILNSASSSSSGGEHRGLKSFGRQLAAYGAMVKELNDLPDRWTYGVVIELERWSGS